MASGNGNRMPPLRKRKTNLEKEEGSRPKKKKPIVPKKKKPTQRKKTK